MKWKAKTNSEAGEVLRQLAKQGEPLLKKLDKGKQIDPLPKQAQNDDHNDSEEESLESTALAS